MSKCLKLSVTMLFSKYASLLLLYSSRLLPSFCSSSSIYFSLYQAVTDKRDGKPALYVLSFLYCCSFFGVCHSLDLDGLESVAVNQLKKSLWNLSMTLQFHSSAGFLAATQSAGRPTCKSLTEGLIDAVCFFFFLIFSSYNCTNQMLFQYCVASYIFRL